jgi:hypothetical protein
MFAVTVSEDSMPRPTLISQALHDLMDDVAYHAVNLTRSAFDLVCLLALGMVVYTSSIDSANAGLGARPMFGVQASVEGTHGAAINSSHAPSSCSLTNDLLSAEHRTCITAMVLEPYGI